MSYSAEAQEKRDMAARARRLAGSLAAEADRERLIRTAQQLEEEARQLESQSDARAAKAVKAPPEPER
jgi:HPt (histidine-containing phosphotransfer) domain-containing protein